MRKIKPQPCLLCGRAPSEWMLDDMNSFRSCDNCKIYGPAGPTSFQATRLWNEMMKKGEVR